MNDETNQPEEQQQEEQQVQSPAKWPSDWVQVRLSEAGLAFAGASGVVTVANTHMRYTFEGTKPTRVLRYAEWGKLLSKETINGQPMFELDE
jgi:hypothetical protein